MNKGSIRESKGSTKESARRNEDKRQGEVEEY